MIDSEIFDIFGTRTLILQLNRLEYLSHRYRKEPSIFLAER